MTEMQQRIEEMAEKQTPPQQMLKCFGPACQTCRVYDCCPMHEDE